MAFDFHTEVNRFNTNSVKWTCDSDDLPVWIADMDFPAAPCIQAALTARLQHGVFGYSRTNGHFFDSVAAWWKNRYAFDMKPEWLLYATGVMPAVHCAVRHFTQPGDKLVTLTPVYHCFFQAIEENARICTEVPMTCEDGLYSVNWEALEAALADPRAKVFILCNPHNPTGTIWTADELRRIDELCRKHNVLVFADEIHCDLTDPDVTYVPWGSLGEEALNNSLIFHSPTKSFNIPGLHTATVCAADADKRARMAAGLHADQVCSPCSFSVPASIAAYDEGAEWLDACRAQLAENKKKACQFFEDELPVVKVNYPKATYLLWLDCSGFCEDTDALVKHLQDTEGLYVSPGSQFRGDGKTHLRFNVATQPLRLEDALWRLQRGVNSWVKLDQQK